MDKYATNTEDTQSSSLLHAVDEVAHGGALAAGADELRLAVASVHYVHQILQRLVGPRAELLLAKGDASQQLHKTTARKRKN